MVEVGRAQTMNTLAELPKLYLFLGVGGGGEGWLLRKLEIQLFPFFIFQERGF